MRPLALIAAFLLGAATLPAQQSPLAVRAAAAGEGYRPVVTVEGLLADRTVAHALASSLPVRVHLRVELWERRTLDRQVTAHERTLALTRDPLDGHYLLDDGRTRQRYPTIAQAERGMQTLMGLPATRPAAGRAHYYLAMLEVETLSLSDLEELRLWLRGEGRPALEGRTPVGRAVTRGARRLFVRVLGLPTRRFEARSSPFVP
jgi:hypothetical protein